MKRISIIGSVLVAYILWSPAVWGGGLPEESDVSSAIDLTLPVHQRKKLHPELSDPVLGDQAQIVEWAWSPQYAERFGLKPQKDGLPIGGLWLVGIKIQRVQSQELQRYTCNIVGLMDNKLPILTPPGEIYTITPGYGWQGGLPGFNQIETIKNFTPAQVVWYKSPKNKLEQTRSERNVTLSYLSYYHRFQNNLAYFEIEGGCGYFNDPRLFRNEIRFPARVDGTNDDDPKRLSVFEPGAIKFDLPDSLMQRIYPYTQEANDWGSCLMRRIGGKPYILSTRSMKSKRFGNICEPITKQQ